jgi:hypothetical protein
MIFDYLAKEFHLKVDYEILETNTDDRVGGRLFTYNFKDNTGGKYPTGDHDYFDVGAMVRNPGIRILQK